jgi:hypothetical protein
MIGRTETTSPAFSGKVKRMLGLDLDGWNTVMVVLLWITACAATAVGITQSVIIKLQKAAEQATKDEYELYKLTVESKVEDARGEGIAAGQAAGNALVRAAELEKQAAELRATNLKLERLK